LLGAAGARGLEEFNQALKRFRFAVEDQIFSELPFFWAEVGVRRDGRRVYNGHIQSRLNAVVKHHAVDDLTRIRCQPERHIADTKRGQHTGQRSLDQADALNGFNR